VSSLHLLYPGPADRTALSAAGLMARQGVQFHWHNRGCAPAGQPTPDTAMDEAAAGDGSHYPDFDAFLATMNHDKRKKVKQERRRDRDAGIGHHWKRGREITEGDWAFFYQCCADTCRRHGH
jgi:predicted N-acyltransferase